MGAQWFDFDDFLKPFGDPFFIKFRNHPNLLKLQHVACQTHFLPDQALEFWHRKSIEIHVFSRRDPGPHFFSFYSLLCQTTRFGDPLRNPIGVKMASKIIKLAPKCSQNASGALTFYWSWNRLASERSPEAPEGSFCMICCAFWDPLGLSFTDSGNNSGTVSCITCEQLAERHEAQCRELAQHWQ